MDNPVLLAQVGAPHGIKGEVRVKTFTDDPLALGDYGKLRTKDGRAFKIMRMRLAKTVVIVKFKGFNHRDEAATLNGLELFVDRSNLPDDVEEDEYYVTDLIGMTAVDETGKTIGTVIAVPDFGAGDLLEIVPVAESGMSTGGSSFYLEFTRANVPTVDMSGGTLTVILPPEVSERDEGDDNG